MDETARPAVIPMTPDVALFPDFAAAPEELFVLLRDETVWDERMRARKTASFGVAYNYSGISYPDVPMPAYLSELAQRVAAAVGHPVNNCLVNFYPDGRSTMGFHSDATDDLHPESTVAVISLGERRTLTFRLKAQRRHLVEYELLPAALLVMAPSVQRDWQHALLAAEGVGPRISLTFRQVVPRSIA